MLNKVLVLSVTSILAAPFWAIGQSGATSPAGPELALTSGVPVHDSLAVPNLLLGRHFFAHLIALENEGQQAEAAGKSGVIYREYYRRLLGFTPQQYAVLKSAALMTQGKLQAIDAQAQQIIRDFRLSFTANAGGPIPAPPPDLQALQNQRDSITASAMSQLRTELGRDAFLRMTSIISTQFKNTPSGKTVATPQAAPPQRPGDPSAPPLASGPVLR